MREKSLFDMTYEEAQATAMLVGGHVMQCPWCYGSKMFNDKGCGVCKQRGWLSADTNMRKLMYGKE